MINIEYKHFTLNPSLSMDTQDEKDNMYLLMALAISTYSTCCRRMYGIVIVKNDIIVGTGYNGDYDGCHRQCTIEGTCLRDLNCVGDDAKFDPCLREELGINLSDDELSNATFYLVCMDRLRGRLMDVGMSRTSILTASELGVKRFVVGNKCNDLTRS